MIYSIEFLYMIKNLKKLLKKLGEALYKIFHWFGSGAKRSGAKRSGAKLQSQTSGKSYLVLSLNFFNYFWRLGWYNAVWARASSEVINN